MLTRIEARNFLSHVDTVVDFNGDEIVAVVGDTGSGKSSLLEAVPYALYGVGRLNPARLSRLSGDGSHEVVVHLKVRDKQMEVTRGRNGSGKGYAVLRVNGDVVAQNSEVEGKVTELMGEDGTMFMTTAYFGLEQTNRSDTLIRVAPAQRLETLQKIANVSVYNRLHKAVKAKLAKADAQCLAREGELEAMGQVIEDQEAIKADIAAGRTRVAEITVELQGLREERNARAAEEDRYRALVRSQSSLREQKRGLIERIKEQESAQEAAEDERDELLDQMQADIDSRRELEDRLAGHDWRELKNTSTALLEQINRNETMRGLKETALHMRGVRTCPLCDAPVDDETIKRWKQQVDELQKKLDSQRKEREEAEGVCGAYQLGLDELKELTSDIENARERIAENTRMVDKAVAKIKDLKGQGRGVQQKYEKVKAELEQLAEAAQAISAINEKIEDANRRLGDAEAMVESGKSRLDRYRRNKKAAATKKKEIKQLKRDIRAYKALMQAWSRYGIPKDLLRELRYAVEDKASRIYGMFAPGIIKINDVEVSGRPGVEFVLMDDRGERPFEALSLGERASFTIAIRTAVSDILREGKHTGAGFMVLDEIAGNLSEGHRTSLMQIVGQILRERFPQVLVISHIPLPDVFDRTIRATNTGGISRVEG